MDAHLFADIVPEGTLPDDGPRNRRRPLAYIMSLWFNADHEQFPLCRFDSYLSLRGWNQDLLLHGQWRDAHPDNVNKSDDDCVYDAIAVLQSWMTLGFLEDLFQNREWLTSYLRPVDEKTMPTVTALLKTRAIWRTLLQRSRGGIRIFTTKNLVSNLIAMTFTRIGLYTSTLTQEHFARLPTLIGQYSRAFNHLRDISYYDEDKNLTRYPINPDTGSAPCFHFTLIHMKLIFEAVRLSLQSSTPDLDLHITMMEQVFVQSLQPQNGWCPYAIEKLYHHTNYAVIHWLWASDFNALDGRDHSSCTTSKCHAVHISSSAEYVEAHADGCDGNCARYYPAAEQVIETLLSGSIPVIIATPSTSGETNYSFNVASIRPSHTDTDIPYVAFSHVWSDGLGSTAEQGIPSCQANFLARVASSQNSLPKGSTAFWIDSLCIPGHSAARKKAIQFMSSTYKEALTVVVLDNTLRKVSLRNEAGRQCSPEYLLLRIYTSPWNQRVWTYQEGALARRLVFLLARGDCIPLNVPLGFGAGPANGPLSISPERSMWHHVYNYLREQVQALNGQVRAINIGTVASELRWRNTKHRDPNGRNDEILAVGTLLQLNMAKLLDEPEGVARMVLFYKLVGRLYRNIVFAEIPRLLVDGFNWAPTTFLVNDHRRPAFDLEKSGVDCTENGLIGTYITFAVEDGEEVLYDHTKRLRLVDGERAFDILSHSKKLFLFTHIIIYSTVVPESIPGTMIIAAAVKEDKKYALTHDLSTGVDFVGTFQTVLNVVWFRNWDAPARKDLFPNGEQVVPGKFQELNVLLR